MKKSDNHKKYKPCPDVKLADRTWPSQTFKSAPIWCSVDLRDGNQALPTPMRVEEKVELFQLLLEIGFKQIEVGFPSASETELKFMRHLVDAKLIPGDVTIQVLTQARENLIEKTFESLQGVKRAIVHLYNSTSELQRRVVFNADQKAVKKIAVAGAELVRKMAAKNPGQEIILQYSPESFTGTELEFALEVCEAVIGVWQPTREKKMIINLPSTVEMAAPNVYADQIEWMSKRLQPREGIILSVHAHNDRGTSVAATELAMLAGAQRVEGTLFGNGERTGNVDLVTVAMNLFSQGIDPQLDFSDINRIVRVYEKCTQMIVGKRSPYAGELVYTAFSGSHQDAIRKGLLARANNKPTHWEVPYIPIDPADVGREYEPIIRINSQSGKGGAAYIMETYFGYKLPKPMHPEFGQIVQQETDRTCQELSPEGIYKLFEEKYLKVESPIKLIKCDIEEKTTATIRATLMIRGQEKIVIGEGNGPIDAFFKGLQSLGVSGYKFISYDEHALQEGSDSLAVAYIQLENEQAQHCFGVGMAATISLASLRAIVNAINRLIGQGFL